jgi:hypothetical protein
VAARRRRQPGGHCHEPLMVPSVTANRESRRQGRATPALAGIFPRPETRGTAVTFQGGTAGPVVARGFRPRGAIHAPSVAGEFLARAGVARRLVCCPAIRGRMVP